MKTLLVMRHAKSSWKEPGTDDHDRPLNERGKRDAPLMGRLLAEKDLLPDRVLSSTAKRARKTAKLVVQASAFEGPLDLTRDLYLADPPGIARLLQALPEEIARPLIVGHNPGMEDLIAVLTGSHETFPTAAVAWLELAVDSWPEVGSWPCGTLRALWRPKEIEG